MAAPVEYEQTDPRWANIPYSVTGNPAQTIGTSGCAPTCAAMVVATLRYSSITPIDAATYALSHGYRTPNSGTEWGFFRSYLDAFKIPFEETWSVDRTLAALKSGYMAITVAGKGMWTSEGHIILAYGVTDGGRRVLIHDPNSEAVQREIADVNKYKEQCKPFWIVKEAWQLEPKPIFVKDIDRDRQISVEAVNINGANFVKLRDFEKLAPVVIGNEGALPTIKANYKI